MEAWSGCPSECLRSHDSGDVNVDVDVDVDVELAPQVRSS